MRDTAERLPRGIRPMLLRHFPTGERTNVSRSRDVAASCDPGSILHAAGEQGIAFREIAEAIGHRLELPTSSLTAEQASQHFGFLAPFVTLDLPTSSTQTRKLLGWEPTGPGLIADITTGAYDLAPVASTSIPRRRSARVPRATAAEPHDPRPDGNDSSPPAHERS